MKVKHKLYISTGVSILLMIILIATVFVFSNIVEHENESRDLAKDVSVGVSELGALTHEYLLNRGEVSERGWNKKYNSVAKILVEGERRHTDRMREQLIVIADIFLQVTRNYKRTLSLVARNAPQSEIDSTVRLEKNMVGQLLTAVQSIDADASDLSASATRKAKSSQTFSNRTNIILLVAIATIITSSSVLVVRSVYRPLEELTKGTKIIGSGNLEFRTGIDSRDEFGLLSQAFDQMTERLNMTTVSRDELVEEIDRRQKIETHRTALLAEIEEKNAELERFAYTVSHDLKSPLITVKGFLGALAQDAAKGNTERMQDDMDRISRAADRMTQLLDGLLDLSRIGRVAGPQEEISFGDVAEDVVSLVAGGLEQGQVQIEVAADLPVVFGDPLRIREVLQNLVENSIKFMGEEPNPLVHIGARQEDGETVLFVRDNGIGIEPTYQHKIFDLFDKLDQHSEGTGLGLALVKRIVEAHGGRAWVESEGSGQGSTFYFTLPLKRGHLDGEGTQTAG